MRTSCKYTFYSSLVLLFTVICNHLPASDPFIIVPWGPDAMSINIYRYTPQTPYNQLNGFQILDKILHDRKPNLQLTTSNLSEFNLEDPSADFFKDTKNLIFCNMPLWIPNWQEKLKNLPKNKLILMTYEPPSVMPEMFSENFFSCFSKVLTWDDSLVDNIKFFKFNYPVLQPMIHPVVLFSQKKLLTQISCNKTSPHPDELYSKRLKAIHYFEQDKSNDFDFYGVGWENLGYKNYKGSPQDKTSVLKNYKFSICYENITNIKGYITEKIFDCFAAGVIPIYWGATNITDYIPKNCFIARKDFPSLKKLVKHLRNMNEAEYNTYLENIRAFLNSEQAMQFSHEAYANSVLKCLDMESH
jgi:alpha(1,3/1,4) fucosyltransferase